jgi:hypothetical protein
MDQNETKAAVLGVFPTSPACRGSNSPAPLGIHVRAFAPWRVSSSDHHRPVTKATIKRGAGQTMSKTVSITVSSNNITVTVTDAPNYPANSATVTARLTPNGLPMAAAPQDIPGGAQFQFSNLTPDGMYLVSVDCGHKLFARVVKVAADVMTDNNAIMIFFTETNPPTIPATFPRGYRTAPRDGEGTR